MKRTIRSTRIVNADGLSNHFRRLYCYIITLNINNSRSAHKKAHQKEAKEDNFYKRNLAFVNGAFILPMGLRGSERDDTERIQNNVIEDLPSLDI